MERSETNKTETSADFKSSNTPKAKPEVHPKHGEQESKSEKISESEKVIVREEQPAKIDIHKKVGEPEIDTEKKVYDPIVKKSEESQKHEHEVKHLHGVEHKHEVDHEHQVNHLHKVKHDHDIIHDHKVTHDHNIKHTHLIEHEHEVGHQHQVHEEHRVNVQHEVIEMPAKVVYRGEIQQGVITQEAPAQQHIQQQEHLPVRNPIFTNQSHPAQTLPNTEFTPATLPNQMAPPTQPIVGDTTMGQTSQVNVVHQDEISASSDSDSEGIVVGHNPKVQTVPVETTANVHQHASLSPEKKEYYIQDDMQPINIGQQLPQQVQQVPVQLPNIGNVLEKMHLSNRNFFIHQVPPQGTVVRCRIEHPKGQNTLDEIFRTAWHCYLDHDGTYLMTAMKQGINLGYKYEIGTSSNFEFHADKVCMRITSNLLGTAYHIYDGGYKFKTGIPENQLRSELAIVTYVSFKIIFRKRIF